MRTKARAFWLAPSTRLETAVHNQLHVRRFAKERPAFAPTWAHVSGVVNEACTGLDHRSSLLQLCCCLRSIQRSCSHLIIDQVSLSSEGVLLLLRAEINFNNVISLSLELSVFTELAKSFANRQARLYLKLKAGHITRCRCHLRSDQPDRARR